MEQVSKDFLKSYIASFLTGKGININKPFKCLNPRHEDNNPSMSFDERSNSVHCFACKARHDIFDLIGMDYGLTVFTDKLNKVQELYGNGIKTPNPLPKRKSEQEDVERYAKAAEMARHIYNEAEYVFGGHPYLDAMNLEPCAFLRLGKDRRLIVPIYGTGFSDIMSVQFIDADGRKSFLKGGKVQGGWFFTDTYLDVPANPIRKVFIGEGLRTMLAVMKALKVPVFVCFSVNNYEPVIRKVQEIVTWYENIKGYEIVLVADNDDDKSVNIGLETVKTLAGKYDLAYIVPDFAGERTAANA